MSKQARNAPCPCGSGKNTDSCCTPVVNGSAPAQTAEALMRSRYTAYTQHNADYLLKTWHPSTRPQSIEFDKQMQWLRLKIVHSDDNTVEFIATWRINGKAHKLHEKSRFVQERGQWFYVDGDTM